RGCPPRGRCGPAVFARVPGGPPPAGLPGSRPLIGPAWPPARCLFQPRAPTARQPARPSAPDITLLSLAIALLGCLAAGAAAQNPCCGPRQFQALLAIRFSPNSTYREAFSNLAFDFTRQMVASNETLIGGRLVTHQRVLVDGHRRTMYIVDHRSRECRIVALTRGVEAPCVPNNFRGEGTLHFGAGRDLLSFNSFRGRVGEFEAQVESYLNVTLGVRDPAVFRVPPECSRSGLAVSQLSQQQLRASSVLMKSFLLGF
uniref:NTR domain-containing protein n=1 Tax=Macrostomum lignano TaxID=282301 RepID=A0A1I8G896_9PLAT